MFLRFPGNTDKRNYFVLLRTKIKLIYVLFKIRKKLCTKVTINMKHSAFCTLKNAE